MVELLAEREVRKSGWKMVHWFVEIKSKCEMGKVSWDLIKGLIKTSAKG